MIVYISGPITDHPNYRDNFNKAQDYIKHLGGVVFNPCKEDGFTYKDYIDMGLAELSKCDTIYILRGWENSKGARLEKAYAETVGLNIIFEEAAIGITPSEQMPVNEALEVLECCETLSKGVYAIALNSISNYIKKALK